MTLDQRLHGLTSPIFVFNDNGSSCGTGFFFDRRSPVELQPLGQLIRRNGQWLVTNRHVILGDPDKEVFPNELSYSIRTFQGNKIEWDEIRIDRSELLKRVKFHTASSIDIATIDILDLQVDRMHKKEGVSWFSVCADDFPDNKGITIETADDVLVIGYPRLYYDEANKFPIIKRGMISTRWNSYFNNHPYFLIDAKLFPGSSGSIVVTKPTRSPMIRGTVEMRREQVFCLLGIFAGEPFQETSPISLENMTILEKRGFNLGIVWYGKLIDEIIDNGVNYNQ